MFAAGLEKSAVTFWGLFAVLPHGLWHWRRYIRLNKDIQPKLYALEAAN